MNHNYLQVFTRKYEIFRKPKNFFDNEIFIYGI